MFILALGSLKHKDKKWKETLITFSSSFSTLLVIHALFDFHFISHIINVIMKIYFTIQHHMLFFFKKNKKKQNMKGSYFDDKYDTLPCLSFSFKGSALYTRKPVSIPQAKHPEENKYESHYRNPLRFKKYSNLDDLKHGTYKKKSYRVIAP